MFGRAFTELFGAMLLTKGFWAAIVVLAAVGYVIKNPMVLLAIAGTIAFGAGVVWWSSYLEAQKLPVNGVRVPVREFQCARCGLMGKLRVEKRTVAVQGGTVQWPFLVCRNCGHEDRVPGHVVG